ncbi:coiled-coil domain-containing protein 150 isoform X2 [Hypomesus transpacificus]|uniref:coiled-coil domain-containing protein 150 isoform X2 n=1 Tax=Hypomesus transpacificus TaxID=137520 RepID=UPI001F0786A4|nr:coiled-coil domain-containing protein 150 isoform X2 [Hypomesus transpacificus]
MSRTVIPSLNVGASTPEALSLLQQRLLVAEEQAEALIKDMNSLGVSRERLLEPVDVQRPVSPLKMRQILGGAEGGEGTLWRQCNLLVSRVCRVESLLQTLKLTTFRLETEREMDPSHSARLKEQLAVLQQESEEEQRTSMREVMKLRDQLCQACVDRDEAQQEVHRLAEALEQATTTKMDVALAAEELKVIKVQMSEKLTEMEDQVTQESARSFKAFKSQSELLQRVEEMERVVEKERRQAQMVQEHCKALGSDAQSVRERLQEEEERGRRLQEECQQLKDQTEVKDCLVFELTNELKSARLALQKQQQENSWLLKDGVELRAVADKLQGLNDQLENQCSELSAAQRSVTVANARLQTEHQASIKAERGRVVQQIQEQDLILEAARRNIQGELKRALSEKVQLQSELETLKDEHTLLVQSSTVTQETAVTQRQLLERTIERLRGELKTAQKDRDVMRQNRDSAKTEICVVVSKLEGERSSLEHQLTETKQEAETLSSTLQRLEGENRRLMGKLAAMEHQQHAQQQVEQMLDELTDNKSKLAYEKGKLQKRVDHLEEELQALKDARVETVQQNAASTCLENKYTQTREEVQAQRGAVAVALAERERAVSALQSSREQLSRLQEQHRDKGELGGASRGGGTLSQTLEGVMASHARLQLSTESLQQELGGQEQELAALRRDKLQGQREVERLQTEVKNLQVILQTTRSKRNKLGPLRETLDMARLDNKKLALSLEQAVLANTTLQGKLDMARDHHQNTVLQREAELHEARAQIGQLSEHLEHMSKEKDSLRKVSKTEISELKKALEDSSAKSGDLSRANRELRGKVSELEKMVSNQRDRIKDQKTQLKQHLESRAVLINSHKLKNMEVELKNVEALKEEYERKNLEQGQQIQQFRSETTFLQRELQRLSFSQEGELESAREMRLAMQDKCQMLEEEIRKLQEAKDEAEQKLWDVSLESQQISENLEEAHHWFRSNFDVPRTRTPGGGTTAEQAAFPRQR